MLFVPIKTERLVIRLMEEKDAPEVFRYRSLPEVEVYQAGWPESEEACASFARVNCSRPSFQPGEYTQLAIVRQEDGLLLGDMGILIGEGGFQAELGFTLAPFYQGQGFGTEAVEAVLGHLFEQRGLHRAYGSVDPNNLPSIRLMERLGFRREAHLKRSYRMRGSWYDDVIYGLLDEEWTGRRRSGPEAGREDGQAYAPSGHAISVRQLDKGQYKGRKLVFEYKTSTYYDVVSEPGSVFSVKLVEKPLPKPTRKAFESALFEDWLTSPVAFAAADGTDLGYIEADREDWHNRMRVTELLVLEPYRGRGIGKALLDRIKTLAAHEGYREIVLETQSCNVPAIGFYMSQGFKVVGIDLSCYTDADLERGEVRLEMAFRVRG